MTPKRRKRSKKRSTGRGKRPKPVTLSLTKGKLSKSTGSSTSGSSPLAPVSTSVTPVTIFERSIGRAENLFKLHEQFRNPTEDQKATIADALRASVVLAVAALDAFI